MLSPLRRRVRGEDAEMLFICRRNSPSVLLSCVCLSESSVVSVPLRLRQSFTSPTVIHLNILSSFWGVLYLDWFSRYVLSWELSNSQDVFFCLSALEKALKKGKPRIFNSDQGSQFTSDAFTGRLKQASIEQSWDGRGRVFDNIFIERLWRSVKYEEVYLNDYQSVTDAEDGLSGYFDFYNNERLHQSLDYMTPQEVHFGF